MAYYCLHELHWPPSQYLSLTREERAFIAAAAELKAEKEKKRMKELERKKARRKK